MLRQKNAHYALENAQWTFAKTMANIPHWWTVRNQWESRVLFDMVVRYINENGVEERFYTRNFTYLYLGEYKYWTCDPSPNDGIYLINRAKI